MLAGGLRVSVILGIAALLLAHAGAAQGQAQSPSESKRAPELEAKVQDQDAVLRERIEEVTAVGEELDQSQARTDGARKRVGDLRQQTHQLEKQLAEQEASSREARKTYRERVTAAYKGESLEGVAALLDGWFGSGGSVTGVWDPGLASVLSESRQSLAAYEESAQDLRTTRRQISQKRSDYEDAIQQQLSTNVDLRRREQALDRAIDRLGVSKSRTEERLRGLKAAERARVLKSRAATGVAETEKDYELKLAQEDIIATDEQPMSKKEYMELYKASAREYGLGPDWYILAAIGAVESNHGENMGPSSAGAMGPMQFLPSTWETSGVDGNGDGVANIMDPEDAIPAAAGYLRVGGAPRDWYRALFSYNHADWYVKKVLAVAEGYRRLAGDEKVGPYI